MSDLSFPAGPLMIEPLSYRHFETFQPMHYDLEAVWKFRQRKDVEGNGYAAVKDGRCLGFLVISEDAPDVGKVTVFPSVELREQHGLTMGRLLLRAAFKQEHYRWLEAEIDIDNRVNRTFAERLGFRMHHMEKGAYIYRRAA